MAPHKYYVYNHKATMLCLATKPLRSEDAAPLSEGVALLTGSILRKP